MLAELAERHFGGPSGFVYRVAVFGGRDGGVLYSSDSDFGTRDMGADAAINLFGPPSGSIGQGPGPLLASPGRPQDQGLFRGPEFHAGYWGLVRFEPLRLSPDDRDWQLVVQHRDGSLEAAVARLRRRNLVIGFGVLLVMAATMGILIITTHRAQRLAKLQMDFVTGVSHELRTPLAVISSAADNIADGVVDNKEQLMRYGKAIKGQTRQLIQLVEQILLFAATRENRYQYQRRVLEVQEILDAAFGATAGLIHSAGIEVETAGRSGDAADCRRPGGAFAVLAEPDHERRQVWRHESLARSESPGRAGRPRDSNRHRRPGQRNFRLRLAANFRAVLSQSFRHCGADSRYGVGAAAGEKHCRGHGRPADGHERSGKGQQLCIASAHRGRGEARGRGRDAATATEAKVT